jgi:hypothetical protein
MHSSDRVVFMAVFVFDLAGDSKPAIFRMMPFDTVEAGQVFWELM